MIRTDRLVLRAGRWADLDPMHEIFSDSTAMRWWDRPAYENIDVTRQWLSYFIEEPTHSREEYIIEYQGACVGKAGCWRKAEIGYILHPSLWGHGFMTEALAAILPRAFAKWPDVAQIEADIDPRNAASRGFWKSWAFIKPVLRRTPCRWADIGATASIMLDPGPHPAKAYRPDPRHPTTTAGFSHLKFGQ